MANISEKESADESEDKPTVTLPATVEKIVQSADPREPEMAEIHIDGASPLYREIRVKNTLRGEAGEDVKLKKGSHVEVTIEANPDETVPKESTTSK